MTPRQRVQQKIDRRIIRMSEQAVTNQQIADRLGITLSAVIGRLHRLRAKGLVSQRGRGERRVAGPAHTTQVRQRRIIRLWNAGFSADTIATRVGLKSGQQIRNIVCAVRSAGEQVVRRPSNYRGRTR